MNLTGLILSELLIYDLFTGKLWWKRRDRKWFKNDHAFSTWNTRFAGKEAFTSIDRQGYFHGTIFGKPYYAHRIIWLMCFNESPDEIDHQDGNRQNNSFINLRAVTCSQNAKNKRMRSDNKSGEMGVHWDKGRNKWVVAIGSDNKTVIRKRFADFADAILFRDSMRGKYEFHVNHGRQ